jgi:hypothetical protein
MGNTAPRGAARAGNVLNVFYLFCAKGHETRKQAQRDY